jgi:hypothetical protein
MGAGCAPLEDKSNVLSYCIPAIAVAVGLKQGKTVIVVKVRKYATLCHTVVLLLRKRLRSENKASPLSGFKMILSSRKSLMDWIFRNIFVSLFMNSGPNRAELGSGFVLGIRTTLYLY